LESALRWDSRQQTHMPPVLPKILVVDDDEESRRLLCEVLEDNGYTVDVAEDGLAAREALTRDGEYRIVIADLRMPKESGLELIKNLRRQKSRHGIVLMSSFISAADRKIAQELGAHALLEKPFRLSDLLDRVGELVTKSLVSRETEKAGRAFENNREERR
jgi:DNA-binding response OmpR family regulator